MSVYTVGKMKGKYTKVKLLNTVFAVVLIGVMATPATAKAYRFEDIFKADLLEIADGNLKIESISIESWSDHRPWSIWALIQINHTAGLSDYEKIAIQHDVARQFQPKWYIDYVEPNYIVTIPELPIPWPGYVIDRSIRVNCWFCNCAGS